MLERKIKHFIDKEMKWLCYMGILKEGFLAYSSPVMLISRKLTKDKRVVTDFQTSECENSKKQLSLSIGQRHIFSIRKFQMSGIVSVRSKRCLSLSKTIRKLKEVLWHTPIFR